MPEPSSVPQISFEIVLPDGTCQLMRVTQSPFYIGREATAETICNSLTVASRASVP